MNGSLSDELSKILLKMDQRLSGHSRLYGQYKNYASISEYLLIGATIILTVLSIADDKYFLMFGLKPDEIKFYFSIYSVVTLVVTIWAWKVDWKGKAWKHGYARKKLSNLKLKCRGILSDTKAKDNDIIGICKECNDTQSEIEPIPENKFNSLKAWHLKKVALSKFTSLHAGKPYVLIWILFYLKTIGSIAKQQ